jgi:hypothetical protein
MTGAITQNTPLAFVLGGIVFVGIWVWWGSAKRRSRR